MAALVDTNIWVYPFDPRFPDRLWSEDFHHERLYGTVRIVNPFV